MKRKMKLLGILVVSAIAILGYAETTHSESLDNLLLENIEALAAGETGSGGACVGIRNSPSAFSARMPSGVIAFTFVFT